MIGRVVRGLGYLVFLGTASFVLLEVGFRVLTSFQVGPEVLLYGTPYCCGPKNQMQFDPAGTIKKLHGEAHTVMAHENEQHGYSKYMPHEPRVDHDMNGEQFSVTINADGFRGKDFETAKASGVVRVVTLGASSTFGYHDRDDETYPVFLEAMLNDRLGGASCGRVRAFEVINLGIPHLETKNIRALLRAEALPLAPDFVTFYEGVNDAAADREQLDLNDEWEDVPLYYKIVRKLRGWLLTFALVDNMLSIYVDQFDHRDLERQIAGKPERFLGNVEAMHQQVTSAGATFIVANQQAKSLFVSREDIRGMSYAEERALVQHRLDTLGWAGPSELYFLVHADLMDGLRDWSRERSVPFVDVIRLMDDRRDHLLSWVHLSPDGNRTVASALMEPIFEHACAMPDYAAGLTRNAP